MIDTRYKRLYGPDRGMEYIYRDNDIERLVGDAKRHHRKGSFHQSDTRRNPSEADDISSMYGSERSERRESPSNTSDRVSGGKSQQRVYVEFPYDLRAAHKGLSFSTLFCDNMEFIGEGLKGCVDIITATFATHKVPKLKEDDDTFDDDESYSLDESTLFYEDEEEESRHERVIDTRRFRC